MDRNGWDSGRLSGGGWSATLRSLRSFRRLSLAINFLVKGADGFRKVVRPGLNGGLPASMTSFDGPPSASSLYLGTHGPVVRSDGWSFLITSE